MIVNNQPPEPIELDGEGRSLDIVDEWKTIQGEGPYAGTPAYFIRLAGCDIQCPLCDTDYTTSRRRVAINELSNRAKLSGVGLVVLTGGEPLRQNISPFLNMLFPSVDVQIETNGTVFRPDIPSWVCVVCSPKTSKVDRSIIHRVDAWKYVVRDGEISEEDGLPTTSLGMSGKPFRPDGSPVIYVQPCDEEDEELNRKNTDAAVASCMRFGYKLCLQIHKIVGLP